MAAVQDVGKEEVSRFETIPYEYRLWRTDLKTIVASVLWGIVITVMLQITERVDTALFAGTFFLFQILLVPFAAGPALFGLPGGWIACFISPIFATLLATSPVAPFTLGTNTLYALAATLTVSVIKKEGRGITLGQMFIVTAVAGAALTIPYLVYIWPRFIGMPMDVVYTTSAILFVEMTLIAPFSFYVVKRILASRVWP